MTPPRTPSPRRPGAATAALGTGARVIDLANEDWCWAQLAGTTRATLFARCAGRTVALDVNYTLDDEEIHIPIASDHALLHVFAGQQVALVLAGRSNDGVRWVVRASGLAVLRLFAAADALSQARRNHPAYHAAVPVDDDALLVLPANRLRGYHENPLDAIT